MSKKTLTYQEWQDWFAGNCSRCHGDKMVRTNGVPRICVCQLRATFKSRLEKIDISPSTLKYLNWSDFSGIIEINGEVAGSLTLESAKAARNSAFKYCFGTAFDESILKQRNQHAYIHKHLDDGQNVVIAGNDGSGRTLLSLLILKEVLWVSAIKNLPMNFKQVPAAEFIKAALWENSRGVDHDLLDCWAEIEFLVIDGLDLEHGGHNEGISHIRSDVLFGARQRFCLPTIFVCSLNFLRAVRLPTGGNISRRFGTSFAHAIMDPQNVVIELVKNG